MVLLKYHSLMPLNMEKLSHCPTRHFTPLDSYSTHGAGRYFAGYLGGRNLQYYLATNTATYNSNLSANHTGIIEVQVL